MFHHNNHWCYSFPTFPAVRRQTTCNCLAESHACRRSRESGKLKKKNEERKKERTCFLAFFSVLFDFFFCSLLFCPYRVIPRISCCIRPPATGKVLVAQVAESVERIIIKTARRNRALKRYAGKVSTRKSKIPNAGNAVAYGYAGKVCAVLKSSTPNAGNAVRYGYAGKIGMRKNIIPNVGNAVGYGYSGKLGAIPKSRILNAGNAVRYGYADKVGTIEKSAVPNADNAIWYGKKIVCFPFRIFN